MSLKANANMFFNIIEQVTRLNENPNGNTGCYLDGGEDDDSIVSTGSENYIAGGNDDDYILVFGDNNIVNTNDGDDYAFVSGNQNTILGGNGDSTYEVYGEENTGNIGNGDNSWVSVGENNSLTVGNGNNSVAMFGDDNEFQAGNGNNVLGFWGDDFTADVGNGNNYIGTFDWVLRNGYFETLAKYFEENYVDYTISNLAMIKGLNDIIINAGRGSNKIHLTVDKDAEVNANDTSGSGNDIWINGSYSFEV